MVICQQLFVNISPNPLASWPQGLQFISYKYEHSPPGFRSNWYHCLKGPTRAAFNKLMQDTTDAINLSSKNPRAYQHLSWETFSAPFWWMLVHLKMLILAPTHKQHRDGLSIQATLLKQI